MLKCLVTEALPQTPHALSRPFLILEGKMTVDVVSGQAIRITDIMNFKATKLSSFGCTFVWGVLFVVFVLIPGVPVIRPGVQSV